MTSAAGFWESVKPCVRDILNDPSVIKANPALWIPMYNFSNTHKGECIQVLGLLNNTVMEFLRGVAQQMSCLEGEALLEAYAVRWNNFNKSKKIVLNLMKSLSRALVRACRQETIDSVFSGVWSKVILSEVLARKLFAGIFEQIALDRAGGQSNRGTIRACVDSFRSIVVPTEGEAGPRYCAGEDVLVNYYKKTFVGQFVAASEAFYQERKNALLGAGSMDVYVSSVRELFAAEKERTEACLEPEVFGQLLKKMEVVFVEEPKKELLGYCESLVAALTTEDDAAAMDDGDGAREEALVQRIAVAYDVIKRLPSIDPVPEKFLSSVRDYCSARVLRMVSDGVPDPRVFSESLLRLYTFFVGVVRTGFGDAKSMKCALDSAFSSVLSNEAIDKVEPLLVPTSLARYCDYAMKRSSKATPSAAQLEEMQGAVTNLFRLMKNREAFVAMYTRLLARRLLMDSSVGEDAEDAFAKRLLGVQSSEGVLKIQRMVTDIRDSTELTRVFQAEHPVGAPSVPSVSFKIVCSGSWALTKTAPGALRLPPSVLAANDAIEKFYAARTQGRVLSLVQDVSRAEVAFTFPRTGAKYLVQASATQLVFIHMALAPGAPGLLFSDAMLAVDVPRKHVVSQLYALVASGLFSCTDGADPGAWAESSRFAVNPAFASKKSRVSVLNATRPAKDRDEPAAASDPEDMENILRDRCLKIEAAIVRILKPRGSVSIAELQPLLKSQLRRWFEPSDALIKRAVSAVIDEEIAKRTPDSKGLIYLPE